MKKENSAEILTGEGRTFRGKKLDQNPCFPAPESSYGIHGFLNSDLATCYIVSLKAESYFSKEKRTLWFKGKNLYSVDRLACCVSG